MNKSPLVIINNEKIFERGNGFYCNNLDLKVIPEGLSKYHEISCIFRRSNKKGSQNINLQNIKTASNILKFLYLVFKTFKKSNNIYLLISITPYTFFSFLILFFFKKKIFVYLRSSGHEEYKYILGSWSVWIYHLMFKIVTSNSTVISVHSRLFKNKKNHLIHPSRLDEQWLKDHKKVKLDKIKLLYVGRINPEKGIMDFIKMLDQIKLNIKLSIVGDPDKLKVKNDKIEILGYISDSQSLIDIYDNHNIVILPSYTEAHPYVVDESLSRKRPMIIFNEISYISNDRKGVFVSERNVNSFTQTAEHIINNYDEIQNQIDKNILFTKQDMLKNLSNIILSN